MNSDTSNNNLKLRRITIVGVLSALSIILFIFDFPLPFFPPFLKIDFTDLPGIIGTIMFDFRVGILIALIKNIVHGITMSSTGGIGEVANFFVSIAFIIPFGLIYHKTKGRRKFIIGCISGGLIMSVIACFMNYYFMIPIYAKIFGMPLETLINMGKVLNKNVNTLLGLIILVIFPFNIIKSIIVSITGFFIYKSVIKTKIF